MTDSMQFWLFFHMYMFFDILTENIFNVVFCCRKKSKILFVMAAMHSRCGYYIFIPWFLLFSLASSQWWQSGCLPYFYTWCGFSTNLECRSEMCCTQLAGSTGRKNDAKTRHLRTIAQLCPAISSTIGKKTFKHQYLLHTSSQYGERRLISGCLGHLSKF